MIADNGLIILSAFILDLILGDPHWMPHPVRWMGKGIKTLENFLRKTSLPVQSGLQTGIPLRTSGVLLVFCIVGLTFVISFSAIKFAYALNHYFGFLISIIIVYTAIAPRNLYDESIQIYRKIEDGNLESARKNLSTIVGRDTDRLDENEIIRASVETIAENIVDAVISPLFYAMLGGAPLAIAYRAVNTMDSMVGHKNARYVDFGWAAARLDDIANYIPARMSAVLIPLSSLICGKDWIGSFKIAFRDGNKNPSPNSGIPEAAVAGALGIRLGGLNYYEGIPSQKPLIGNGAVGLSVGHIKETNRLMLTTSGLTALLCITCSYLAAN